MRSKVSSWVRQSRHRAKKYDVLSKLEVQAIQELLDYFNDCCAYCGKAASTLDHPFPLSCKAPNILANVLPSCHDCKTKKGTTDLVAFFNDGHLQRDKFLELVRGMLERDGGNLLREHIKGVTGIGL